MKKIIILSLVIFLALPACEKKDATICGVDDPATELPWLAEIIALAETDTTGNYRGTIYLESYKGETVFWVEMMMGSGGLAGWCFSCDGSRVEMDQGDFLKLKRNKIIYTNELN